MIRFFIPIFCFLVFNAMGQGARVDSVFLSSSIKSTKALYDKWMGSQTPLYSGLSAKKYNSDIDPLPFYLPDWEEGSVYYDKQLYENVSLMYDLVLDKLIVSQVQSYAEIELISEKIARFTILNHSFIHLGPSSAANIDDGFYELLYDGTVKLFAKRKKVIEESIEGNKVVSEVSSADRYFIYKDNFYTPVKKLSSVLAVLKDKELKSYSKKNNLNFRKNLEASLLLLVSHYDQASR